MGTYTGLDVNDAGSLASFGMRTILSGFYNIPKFPLLDVKAMADTGELGPAGRRNCALDAPGFEEKVYVKFDHFGNNVLNIGIQSLEGCTVVTVVSRSAVYMGHFFESLAFAPEGKAPDTAFQQNCINFITGQGQTWRTRGDSLDPSLFSGPAVAFIMTPRQDQDDPTEQNPNPPVPGADTQLYGDRMRTLSQTLTNLIPGITIVYYNYIAINIEEYQQAYQGKALFGYDSNADGAGNPNFRLWYEQTFETGINLGLL
ncbi:uncharacterized protein F4807DRAFT_458977 [Annulohypoxylon truncatum]|uniref:uncharacterized protein n=1 Tax=Annulohypoxylon truncatum TaxID=327061 RepID=UPI00200762E6|nr:uncharacterized protein F4807DRAFT_458977 [Annulohypoxylon truncatum]KAI1211403.1 hypothetical protein F4807DRAFT_458977 [Annulohypoxylon truncatum]